MAWDWKEPEDTMFLKGEGREPRGRRFETPLNMVSASPEDQCLVIFYSYLEILLHLHKFQIGQDKEMHFDEVN